MNNPFSQSKVTYKISFTTYFKNLEEFESIIDNIFEESLLGLSTSEISSQTIDSLPQDIWLIEIYLSENPGLDFARETISNSASPASLAIIEEISLEKIEDADWVSIYQAGLKPIEIGNFFGNASNLCFGVTSDIVCYFKGNRDGINRSNMRLM